MGLLDSIREAQQQATKGPRCTAGLLLDHLSADDAEDLAAALDDPTLMATHIAKVLTDRGHTVSDNALQRHRRGACSCRR